MGVGQTFWVLKNKKGSIVFFYRRENMGRKCSHCGKTGHNSRTCNSRKRHVSGGRFRLFGVQLDHHHLPSSNSSSFDKSSFSSYAGMNMKKSFSVDCLSSSSNSSSSSSRMSNISATSHSTVHHEEISDHKLLSNGYLSDGFIPKSPQDRKKGVQWTEEEHRIFLIGLEKLGKGDWRGISRNFVTTRTPTQVASHAQKYFLRQNSPNKRKRRPSLLDVGTDQLSLQMVNNVSISKPTNYIDPSTIRIDPFGFSAKTSTTVPTSFLDHINYSTRLGAGKFVHSDHSPMSNHQYRRAQAISNAKSFDSQLPTSSSSTGTAKGVAPDLELALAAPMAPLGQQSKPCGRGLLFGPISVT